MQVKKNQQKVDYATIETIFGNTISSLTNKTYKEMKKDVRVLIQSCKEINYETHTKYQFETHFEKNGVIYIDKSLFAIDTPIGETKFLEFLEKTKLIEKFEEDDEISPYNILGSEITITYGLEINQKYDKATTNSKPYYLRILGYKPANA